MTRKERREEAARRWTARSERRKRDSHLRWTTIGAEVNALAALVAMHGPIDAEIERLGRKLDSLAKELGVALPSPSSGGAEPPRRRVEDDATSEDRREWALEDKHDLEKEGGWEDP